MDVAFSWFLSQGISRNSSSIIPKIHLHVRIICIDVTSNISAANQDGLLKFSIDFQKKLDLVNDLLGPLVCKSGFRVMEKKFKCLYKQLLNTRDIKKY